MKRITSMTLALLILFGGVFNIINIDKAYAKEEQWTEEDFLYSSPGNIIAFSDKGMEKQKNTKVLVFPKGTKSITGNYSLGNDEDRNRFNREFGRGKEYDLVIIPDSVEYLGYAVFYAGRIDEVKLSANLKTISGLAFNGCGIRKVILPDTLVTIEENAFSRNNLQEIIIPESVKNIEQYAFSKNNLNTVKILGNPNISNKGAFHKQTVQYTPKQNPFYEAHFGYNGKIGLEEIPSGLVYDDGMFSFKNDKFESVTTKFEVPEISYSGSITINNPHKWESGTQTDLTGDDIDNLESTIKLLEDKIKDIEEEKELSEQKIIELEKKLQDAKKDIQDITEEKESLNNSLKEKQEEIDRLVEQINNLKTSDTEKEAEIIQLQDEIKALTKENTKLKEDLESAKLELEVAKDQNEKDEEKIKTLEEKIIQLETKISKLEEDIKAKTERIEKLKKLLEEKESRIIELEKLLQEKELEKENLNNRIKELEKTLKDVNDSKEENKKMLEDQISKLKEEIKSKEAEIIKLNEDIKKYLKEIEDLKKSLESNKNNEDSKDGLDKKLEEILKIQKELEQKQKYIEEKEKFILEVDELKEGDKEVTGKSSPKYYIDIFRGNKRIGGTTADNRGYFTVKLKEELKADEKLRVVAENPKDAKNTKEMELTVKAVKDKQTTEIINSVPRQDELIKKYKEFTIFQINKNYYNIISKDKKVTVYMDVKAFIKDDRTMLPLRYVAYALGFNVEYNDDSREAIFSNKENPNLLKKTLYLNIDTGEMRDQDGNKYKSEVKPLIINGRIHAAITNIANIFGASNGDIDDGKDQTIEWDKNKSAVYVFKFVK